MNDNLKSFLFGLVAAIILFFIIIFVHSVLSDGTLSKRFSTLLGGDLPGGFIQLLTYTVFFFGLIRIIILNNQIKIEKKAFDFELLPQNEQFVLDPTEVNQLKLRVIQKEESKGKYILTDLIKKVCTKFRSNKSTSEALEVLTNQVRINLSLEESNQSLVRYAAWAIPSIGFIGTIIGIAKSLGSVTSNMGEEDIVNVTSSLNIAFDTTLIALILSLILMFFYHSLQEKSEKLHLNMEHYVIENLINRIYKG